MKVAIILNGISLKKKFLYHEILPVLRAAFNIEVFETITQNDAITLASKATEKKYDVILAAGGDGTVHQVVNGILHERENSSHLPALGLIPIGSGNDFARTLSVSNDPYELVELIKNFKPHKIDVGKLTYSKDATGEEAVRYFINEVDVGMGPKVVKKVLASGRPFGSAVTYYLAILSTFATYTPFPVQITTSGWRWEGKIRTLALVNGRYYGNGLCIGPDAKPDDGKLSTFICGDVSVFDFVRFSSELKKGKYVRIPNVFYNEAQAAELTSPGPCVIQADGELLGWLPATIGMLPYSIPVLY